MNKKTTIEFENVTRLKKVAVVTCFFVSLVGGMFAGIVSISKFENYISPYLFGFTFGTLGFIIGIYVAKRIKQHVILNPIMRSNYSQLTGLFSVGFIGFCMLLGFYLNNSTSTIEKCDNFNVVDKIYHEGGFRRPELNILVVNVDGENRRILCNPNYWQTISVGQQIKVCVYKSKIGFDYLTLTNKN